MHNKASAGLGILIMIASGCAVFIATGWPLKAALFPIAIGVCVFCLAAAEVLWVLLGSAAADPALDFRLSSDLPAPVAARRSLEAAGWMLGFFGVIVLAGFPIAIPLFVALYLRLQGRESWTFSAAGGAVAWAFFFAVFDRLLHVPVPKGWLLGWIGL